MSNKRKKTNKKWNIELHWRRKLVKRYPFLMPKSYLFTGEVLSRKQKQYAYRSLRFVDDMSKGWFKRFGLKMLEEIREELLRYNYLNEYCILQVKEKYGHLCVYDAGVPIGCKVEDIIGKYSRQSECVCIKCGTDGKMVNAGWFIPLCERCFSKAYKNLSYEDCIMEDDEDE